MRFSVNDARLKWSVIVLIFIVLYSFIYLLYHDKYQSGGNAHKYDISAEVFKRIFINADIKGIDKYCKEVYGEDSNILENGHATAITDERPLYFFYMALIKSISKFPLGINFFLNIVFLLSGLLLIGIALKPNDIYLFVLFGGVLLSPFMVYHAFIYEPHILEIFLTCVGIYFYKKENPFFAFFFVTLSVFVHPGNIILLGCFGIYHIVINRKKVNIILYGIAGGFVSWICMEVLLGVSFYLDQDGVLVFHRYFIEGFINKAGRTSGKFSVDPGRLSYWRDTLAYLPLSLVGVFWIKNKLQFVITLLPVLIYLVACDFYMPIQRVLLPVYFLGYCYFIHNFLSLKKKGLYIGSIGIIIIALFSSLLYYSNTYRCQSLKDTHSVKISSDYSIKHSNFIRQRLFWNLKRFNFIEENSSIEYNIVEEKVTNRPNIADPYMFYPYIVQKILLNVFSEDKLKRMGFRTTVTWRLNRIEK